MAVYKEQNADWRWPTEMIWQPTTHYMGCGHDEGRPQWGKKAK
ncbi:MAG: hypothetical protein ACLU8D_01655 [Enterocloster sp.]